MHHRARNNIEMSRIVEQGITRDLLHGSVMAWKFLASNKVPEDVILRVLADPGKRRESDHWATGSEACVLNIAGLATPPNRLSD